ncbi:LuxR C-terminal-related transcriptional regulator [Glycomyces luteolus]|uniref:LuxR C-terminal-related transcriptional regulator n=1 Tax=Glycomyces luteolus TaxID=2670330 RepID=A0A9X3PDT2_9ACTN|nr:LuxR C-terminal-related transcriptional regulator [Glycomyces luteolus]MDA1361892.1 LuxR C-terminal-related transcriptional regulator [Glycomyces luteolus]
MSLAESVTAADCVPLFVELSRRQVDAVLVDVALAAPDPAKFANGVLSRFPRTGVLLSGAADPRIAATVAAAGVLGVIRALPGNTDDLLVAFAQAILLARTRLTDTSGSVRRPRSSHRAPTELSEREFQVLAGIAEGEHSTAIGRELFVAEGTVRTHAKRRYPRSGARERAHAVAIAFRSGLAP